MDAKPKIYMDVCCLNRPFDDWTQPRIRLEAEAILEILAACQARQFLLFSSTALENEINRTPDPLRRQRVLESLDIAHDKIIVDQSILDRAQEIATIGCKPFDALHIACAENAQADVFLTTDDRLIRKAQANPSDFQVQVANPLQWLIQNATSSGE
ncbi:MAG: PIN domain-containing protein [Leptolyngbya sp. Prado105]|jgi:predicted nucleic acid-binding protein|nr:PIN domain-containing protein [Leptolyngbya sp. Prado105]